MLSEEETAGLTLRAESTTDLPDQHLAEVFERCRDGDVSAFRHVVREFQGFALALAYRILRDEEESKDVVQEAFIRIWRHFARYDPKTKFTTWLYSIVTHLCYDRLRGRRKRRETHAEHIDERLPVGADPDNDPEQRFAQKELADAVGHFTEKLPPTQRLVFVLRDLQELSVREVSSILHISESSVKTNLLYARRFLREQLKPFLQE